MSWFRRKRLVDDDTWYDEPGPRDPADPPTERDGLRVGMAVMVNDRWPAVVVSFDCSACDVVVEWTSKKPSLNKVNTVCRKTWHVHAAEQPTPAAPSEPGGES